MVTNAREYEKVRDYFMRKRHLLPVLVLVLAFALMLSASAAGFTDVPGDAFYADAVNWAVSKGITNGTSDTTFSPEASCTRAEMVTFLWRCAGSPKAQGSNPFSDVPSGEYYYDAVLWAYSKGVTRGIDATHFNPNGTVTRAEAVTFIWRGAGSPATGSTGNFSDVAPDQYYTDAVAWGHANGIVKGYEDDSFRPDQNSAPERRSSPSSTGSASCLLPKAQVSSLRSSSARACSATPTSRCPTPPP